jgi:hypothetical protein
MEKQKLIEIILKDLGELNEIASELSNSNGPSKFAMDIALSKSKLVYQELEFLNELHLSETSAKAEDPVYEEPQLPFPSNMEEAIEPETQEDGPEETGLDSTMEVPDFEEAAQEDQVGIDDTEEQTTTIEEYVQEEHLKETVKKTVLDEDEIQSEEEEEDINIKKTLGDHFIKGKSLNDFLTESKTSDNKLPGSHINKLENAIGLNDRFQYTRELFNNNPELFRNTIQQLDRLNNLHEAVAFLNSNFKWKKTDTSIQFAQLVKRRFSN